MMNLYIYCEGQTEESFVKNSLMSHFIQKNIILYPIICRTKEGPNGIFKGGLTDYNKAVKEIKRLCTQHPNEKVTSFIDYYGLRNIPQVIYNGTDKYQLILSIEQKFYEDVGCKNFIPYISLHEFESLLFSKPIEFAYLKPTAVPKLNQILNEFENNPELINSGKETAPSKRILREIDNYSKVLDGTTIAKKISLLEIRNKCQHFNNWITILEDTSI